MGYEFLQDKQETHGDERRDAAQGGISKVILDQKDWFNAWLEGEKKCRSNFLSVQLGPWLLRTLQSRMINTMKSLVLPTLGSSRMMIDMNTHRAIRPEIPASRQQLLREESRLLLSR